MTRRSSTGDGGGRPALRWLAAGAVALGLHAGAALLLLRDARPEPIDAGGGGAIAVELDPLEGEAGKPDEAPPAAPADEAQTAAADAAAAEASRAAPQPPAEMPPPQPPSAPPPSAGPPPSAAAPELPAPPPPEPTPQPSPESQPPKAVEPPRPDRTPVEAARASAASAASAAAEDAAPSVQRLAAGRAAAWRGKLVPHLDRFRRPVPGIGGGTARIGFTVDADGRVIAVSVATSSGSAALDEAARALIRRASPFPPPPPGTAGPALSFVVPIHYDPPATARHP